MRASKDLLQQIAKAHPGIRWISIGGDEALHLGECPKCADYVKEHDAGELYVGYISKLIGAVKDMGLRPIVYADMLLAFPALLGHIDHSCILGDWDYDTISSHPRQMMDRVTKKRIDMEQIEGLPAESRSLAAHLIDRENNCFYPFGYTKLLQTMGYTVLAHPSSVAVGPTDYWTPNYNIHAKNITVCCDAVKRSGGIGIVNTAWERFLPDTPLYGFVLGAALAWGSLTKREFDRRFCRIHFGDNSSRIVQAMYRLSSPYTLVEKKFPRIYDTNCGGRGNITLKTITENKALRQNITGAAAEFLNALGYAPHNRKELRQWILGAQVKLFWLDFSSFFLHAEEKHLTGKPLEDELIPYRNRVQTLSQEAVRVLSPMEPQGSVEGFLKKTLTLFDTLCTQLRLENYKL